MSVDSLLRVSNLDSVPILWLSLIYFLQGLSTENWALRICCQIKGGHYSRGDNYLSNNNCLKKYDLFNRPLSSKLVLKFFTVRVDL